MAHTDLTAPGFDPEAVGLPWYRRAWRQGIGYQAPSVLFLAIPLLMSAREGITPRFWAMLVVLVTIGAIYIGATLIMHTGIATRVLWCATLGALVVLLSTITHDWSLSGYYVSFVTVPMATLLPWHWSRTAIPLLGVAGMAASIVAHDYFAFSLAIFGIVMSFSMAQGIQSGRRQRQLRREQERAAVLAVAAERERIGRDLHDILGHSLTAIAVKTELASRLIERDPAAAKTQIDEVTTVARQALADVRSTASGMREVRVATELASARSVLAAADIECSAPSSLPLYDDSRSEVLGYVVREAVTNVVRHAGARHCAISATESQVSISDDGRGFSAEQGGSGLRGLRDRVAAAGGSLTVDSSGRGTTLTCTLPEEAA